MYNYILFDLDGTLTDSSLGIKNGVVYALNKFGIEVKNRDELDVFIGPPLVDAFMSYANMSLDDSKRAVEYYREFYRVTGIYENRVYDGVEQMLEVLYNQGKTLIVATSKPEPFAKIVLEHFDLAKYFSCIVGATFDGKLNYKKDVIAEVFKRANITDKSKAIMIGDRHHDIEGAIDNDVDSIGVLYGFGDREELKNAGATYIAEQPNTVVEIINNN